jgi:probable rRNA maturation factor
MIVSRQREVQLNRPSLETFWRRVRDELNLGEAEVTICLVSDAEIARMNVAFRKKKGPTDVLSFPAVKRRRPVLIERGRRKKKMERDLGDIAIAPATAHRNAKKQGRTLATEMRILMLHGVLHLLGYDHQTDHGRMNRLEHKLRRRLGLA